MAERRDVCRECGRAKGYLMADDHTLPGALDILRGEAGELPRVLLTVALCALFVLLITGLEVSLRL